MHGTDGKFYELPHRRFYPDGVKDEFVARHRHLSKIVAQALMQASNGSPYLALPAVRALRHNVDRLERNAVAIARGARWSWRDIGEALGLSRSAVQRRFAKNEVASRRRRREPPGQSGTT
jgi:hypothetical protein